MMEKVRSLAYDPFAIGCLLANSILMLVCFTFLFVAVKDKTALIILASLFIFFLPITFYSVKFFLQFIKKTAAIELTQDLLIDNGSGIAIPWDDIVEISAAHFQLWTFLTFKLKDANVYRKQLNPFLRRLPPLDYWLTGYTCRINISLVRGKNETVIETIFTYYQKAKGHSESEP